MRMFKMFFVFIAMALLVSTSLTVQAQGATPPYAAGGPHAVGRSFFLLGKGTAKPMILIAWYPALK